MARKKAYDIEEVKDFLQVYESLHSKFRDEIRFSPKLKRAIGAVLLIKYVDASQLSLPMEEK